MLAPIPQSMLVHQQLHNLLSLSYNDAVIVVVAVVDPYCGFLDWFAVDFNLGGNFVVTGRF